MVKPGVSDVQTDKAELRRQHPGFCSSMRTAAVDVGAACRARIGRFANVIGSIMERILGGRRLRMIDQLWWMLRLMLQYVLISSRI